MLLSEKYIPLDLNDSIINKKITTKLLNFTTETFTNIIFYGVNGTGKYTLTFLLIKHLFGCEEIKTKKKTFNLNKKEFMLRSSNVHYEICMHDTVNKHTIKEILIQLSSSVNIYTNYPNIIVIKQAQYLFPETVKLIKTLIEKKRVIFILLTNSLNMLNNGLINNFIKIRIPTIDTNEIVSLLKLIKKKEKIKIYIKDIKKIINSNKNNITRIMYNLELYKNSESVVTSTKLEDKLDYLIKMICSDKKYDNIKTIRKELYDICSHHNNRTMIVKYLYNNIIHKHICIKKKAGLTKLTADIQHKLVYSYRNIIHLEYYISELIHYVN